MVEKVRGLWICEECKLKYKEKNWAEKCEKWCKEHKSCNLQITRHAVDKCPKPKLWKGAPGIAAAGGVILGILGFFGFTGLCCVPLVLVFLGFFGISSGMFLMTNKWWYLIFSVIFFVLAIIFLKRPKYKRERK